MFVCFPRFLMYIISLFFQKKKKATHLLTSVGTLVGQPSKEIKTSPASSPASIAGPSLFISSTSTPTCGEGSKFGKFMKQKKPKQQNKAQGSRFCSTASHHSSEAGRDRESYHPYQKYKCNKLRFPPSLRGVLRKDVHRAAASCHGASHGQREPRERGSRGGG